MTSRNLDFAIVRPPVGPRDIIPPANDFARALLVRDGLREFDGAPKARPPLEMELPEAPGLWARLCERVRMWRDAD